MTTTKENLTKLMTTTAEEDTQYLNEVISPDSLREHQIKIKRKPGRPRIYTPDEAKERIRDYDRRRYHADPAKKIALVIANNLRKKSLQ